MGRFIQTPGDSTYYDNLRSRLSKKYGNQRGLFLANRLARDIRKTNDFCMDNWRVAKVGNEEEEKLYQEAIKNGCCGFQDAEYTFIDKVTGEKEVFKIGYNFGH